MNRTLLRTVVVPLVLAACAASASGQDAAPAARGSIVVYSLQDLSGPGATHEFEQPITDAVVSELGSIGVYDVVAPEKWAAAAQSRDVAPRDLLQGAAAASLARDVSADMAVSGSYAIVDADGGQQIALSLQCWDAASGRLLAGLQRTTRFDLAFYIALQGWVDELVQSLQSGQGVPTQAEAQAITAASGGEISFRSADNGMQVVIAGDTPAGVIANGKLSFPVGAMPTGTPLTVTKEKAGYHESVQAIKSAPVVNLTPLAKLHDSAAEVTWTTGQLLGIGGAVRGYAVPDTCYLYAGNYIYLQTPQSPALRGILHDDIFTGFGGYLFFPPGALFRFSLATGAGFILSAFSQQGMPVYTDLYLNVASWTLETRILGPTLFIRQEFKYTLGIATNLEGRGWPVTGFPLTTIGILFQ